MKRPDNFALVGPHDYAIYLPAANPEYADVINTGTDFAKFYPIPAMGHCSGGPSTDQVDFLTPLVQWVESGLEPKAITASVRGAGNVGGVNADLPKGWAANRTRPLCAYPTVARYKGSGDVEKAENFNCK